MSIDAIDHLTEGIEVMEHVNPWGRAFRWLLGIGLVAAFIGWITWTLMGPASAPSFASKTSYIPLPHAALADRLDEAIVQEHVAGYDARILRGIAMDKPRVINLNELPEGESYEHDGRFACRVAAVAGPLGARKLGYNVTAIPPGKKAFPYHFHHTNEEMFLVLSGTGEFRWPGGAHPLEPMDVVCCPPGEDSAHQFVNTGSTDLRYLAVSTLLDPEVIEYPDSGKYVAVAGRPLGGKRADAKFGIVGFKKDGVDYWAGE